jgi:hypothetical protein
MTPPFSWRSKRRSTGHSGRSADLAKGWRHRCARQRNLDLVLAGTTDAGGATALVAANTSSGMAAIRSLAPQQTDRSIERAESSTTASDVPAETSTFLCHARRLPEPSGIDRRDEHCTRGRLMARDIPERDWVSAVSPSFMNLCAAPVMACTCPIRLAYRIICFVGLVLRSTRQKGLCLPVRHRAGDWALVPAPSLERHSLFEANRVVLTPW